MEYMRIIVLVGIASLLFLLGTSFWGVTLGQSYVPGVSIGDVFKYEYDFNSNINGGEQLALPSMFDSLLEQIKAIDWVQVTISKVTGTTVEAQMLTQFINGTQKSSDGTIDVASGQGDLTMFLIASNLGPNDPMYIESDEKINGTTTKTYKTESRELIYESITMEYSVSPDELEGFNITVPLNQVNSQEIYWDKQTGSLVEMRYRMLTSSSIVNADISMNVNLVESNVYAIPEYPVLIIFVLALIIPTIAVLKARHLPLHK
jgi:hypothetical protein